MSDQPQHKDRRVLISQLESIADRIARSPVQVEDASVVRSAAQALRSALSEGGDEAWQYGVIRMGRRWYATRFHPSTEDNDGDLPDVGDTEFWEAGDWHPYSISAFQERERAAGLLGQSSEGGDDQGEGGPAQKTIGPERWMVDYEHGEGEPQHAVLSWLSTDPTVSLPETGTELVRLSEYERVREEAIRFAEERDKSRAATLPSPSREQCRCSDKARGAPISRCELDRNACSACGGLLWDPNGSSPSQEDGEALKRTLQRLAARERERVEAGGIPNHLDAARAAQGAFEIALEAAEKLLPASQQNYPDPALSEEDRERLLRIADDFERADRGFAPDSLPHFGPAFLRNLAKSSEAS